MILLSQDIDWFYRFRRRIATAGAWLCWFALMPSTVIFGANGMVVTQQKRTGTRRLRRD